MNSNFEEIFQGWLEKEEYNKNKGFLKKSKYWKKYYCVLRRYEGDSNVYLQWFEKEEDWRREFPKGTFGLFPKYSVYKHKTERGKSYFEISNDEEAHYMLANNETTMDLWVIQLMMQTRLNSSMIETSFRVKGGENKCLQRIGAKTLNCLLHISEWGMTLALERTHSVLSQWPLTTIRNYECTDNNEFVFESGRKSPMGEGKYEFQTTNSEDNAIFDQLDHYTSLRARRVSSTGRRDRLNSANDDEIAQAYGQLRWSVMLTKSQLNLGVIHGVPSQPSQPQVISLSNNHAVYNHLDRQPSVQGSAIGDSYDRLDRTGSLSDRLSLERSYSRLNCSGTMPSRTQSQRSMGNQQMSDSYDHLERTPSFNGSPSSADSRSKSFGSLEGRSRFQFASPPAEDSYNHLARYRHASLPSSASPTRNAEFYDKLDRSMASLHQGSNMNSYDRLDSMQGSRDMAMSPQTPTTPDGSNPYDTFGNLRAHTPTSYQFHKSGAHNTLLDQEPLVVELPPPLPQKPSFMSRGERKPSGPSTPSPEKRDAPLPLKPSMNEEDRPERRITYSNQDFNAQRSDNGPQNGLDVVQNGSNPGQHYQAMDGEKQGQGISKGGKDFGQHYQAIDNEKQEPQCDTTKVDNPGQHYQAVDNEKQGALYQAVDEQQQGHGTSKGENNAQHHHAINENREEPEYAEPRARLNTHSSNPDLSKITGGKSKLDPSKRTTIHRSAPSLALYTLVDKKSKGSPKGSPKGLSKAGSTFKLFKKLGRSSKKVEEDEKVLRKNKKSQKKDNRVVSTSSLRPLVIDDDSVSYVDIDGEESVHARDLMERRDSKRPLPDLPAASGVDV